MLTVCNLGLNLKNVTIKTIHLLELFFEENKAGKRFKNGASFGASFFGGIAEFGFEAYASVAELVDAPDLGSGAFGREGSTPFARTIFKS